MSVLVNRFCNQDNIRWVVNAGTSAKKEVVHGLEVGNLLASLEDVVFRGTEAESFLALRLRAGEHNNVASHGGCKLDGKMAQASDTHDSHTVC